MHDDKTYQYVGRTVRVGEAPVGANGPSVQAFSRDFLPGTNANLWIQDLGTPVAANNSEVTASLLMSGGFGQGSTITTQIGPGSAVRFPVSGQTRLTLQQLQAGAGNTRAATSVYLWLTYEDEPHSLPPTTWHEVIPAGAAYTEIGPNDGFAPPYRSWISIEASQNYDLAIREADGTFFTAYANIVPPNPTLSQSFIVPAGMRVSVRPNGGAPIGIIATWTEKRNS